MSHWDSWKASKAYDEYLSTHEGTSMSTGNDKSSYTQPHSYDSEAGSYSGYKATPGYGLLTCVSHDGPHWIIEHSRGKTELVGEKETRIDEYGDLALIIDCSSGAPYLKPADTGRIICPEQYRSLEQYAATPTPRIQVPWPDYGVPKVTPEFWRALVDQLPDGLVGVCCMGGEGRTGTTLAAIAIVAYGYSAAEAFDAVRRDYCKKAIESEAQGKYLAGLARYYGTVKQPEKIVETVADLRPLTKAEKKAARRARA